MFYARVRMHAQLLASRMLTQMMEKRADARTSPHNITHNTTIANHFSLRRAAAAAH